MSLPDYCPPLSTLLERTNNLKVDWKGSALDVSRDPYLHLLHRDEVGLAASLRLDCATYLTSKRRIFVRRLECARVGKEFRKTDAQQACRIDVKKAFKLWTAYEEVGWLRIEHMRWRLLCFISANPVADFDYSLNSQSKYQVQVARKLRAKEALQAAKTLESTVVYNGYFLDYYVSPAIKTHLVPATMFVDMVHNEASIPGAGDTPVVYSHTSDVGELINASLDLERWEPETFISCDRVTLNEFVRLAEAAKGTKFKVSHDSVDDLKAGRWTDLSGQKEVYKFFPKDQFQGFVIPYSLLVKAGAFDLKPEKTLNDMFPGIKTSTVKGLLEKAWKVYPQ